MVTNDPNWWLVGYVLIALCSGAYAWHTFYNQRAVEDVRKAITSEGGPDHEQLVRLTFYVTVLIALFFYIIIWPIMLPWDAWDRWRSRPCRCEDCQEKRSQQL